MCHPCLSNIEIQMASRLIRQALVSRRSSLARLLRVASLTSRSTIRLFSSCLRSDSASSVRPIHQRSQDAWLKTSGASLPCCLSQPITQHRVTYLPVCPRWLRMPVPLQLPRTTSIKPSSARRTTLPHDTREKPLRSSRSSENTWECKHLIQVKRHCK